MDVGAGDDGEDVHGEAVGVGEALGIGHQALGRMCQARCFFFVLLFFDVLRVRVLWAALFRVLVFLLRGVPPRERRDRGSAPPTPPRWARRYPWCGDKDGTQEAGARRFLCPLGAGDARRSTLVLTSLVSADVLWAVVVALWGGGGETGGMRRVRVRWVDVGWVGALGVVGVVASVVITVALSRGWAGFPQPWVIQPLGAPLAVGALVAGVLGARLWVVWAGVVVGVVGEVVWFVGWLGVTGAGQGASVGFALGMLGAPGVPVALLAGGVGTIGVLLRRGVRRLGRGGDWRGPVCAGCGYSLVGLRGGGEGGTGRCPECGRGIG